MTVPSFDKEIAALASVPLSAWVVLVTVLGFLFGLGYSSRANSEEIKKHDERIERKAEKDYVKERFDDIVKRLDELKEDIKEEQRQHHGERSDRSGRRRP